MPDDPGGSGPETTRPQQPAVALPKLPVTASVLRAQIKAAVEQWEDESAVCGYGLDEAVMRVVQPVLEMAWGLNRGEIEGLAVVSLDDLRKVQGRTEPPRPDPWRTVAALVRDTGRQACVFDTDLAYEDGTLGIGRAEDPGRWLLSVRDVPRAEGEEADLERAEHQP